MKKVSVAPCGVICDICQGFQRTKNRCVGCNSVGFKPNHCSSCSIKTCPEKLGDETLLCSDCSKFPCIRIKKLDKRYREKYGESPIENLENIKKMGADEFINTAQAKWTCSCGNLLCVHSNVCLKCGSKNPYSPK
ncbi:MAG: DUF3795 domain-containing protein [Spirochaetales bacterium]|nr:DUF3795 domain-containing protein [Spirochaetales bacterium]